MYGAVILLIVIAVIALAVTICVSNIKSHNAKGNNKVQRDFNPQHVKREIQYLEFTIVGGNSPFSNFAKRSEFTLLSYPRLQNIKFIVEQIIENSIEGDILEAGNWRGGSMLYAKGILQAYRVYNKEMWMFDTFCGFPKNITVNSPSEKNLFIGGFANLMRSNSVQQVKALFEVYNLSKGVNLIAGLFQDTIPKTKIPKLSYLRLDADSYANTKYLLESFYDKLNVNGYIEFDDYGSYPGCKKAVDEFRRNRNINDVIVPEYEHPGKDKYYEAIYWKKTSK